MKKALAYAVLAAGSMLLSVASYGQTVIDSVPFTITKPGKYILQGNLFLNPPGVAAIAVRASNVNIDLSGFSLLCSGFVFSSGIQVVTGSVHDVVIQNGTINNFTQGIIVSGASAVLLENVQVTSISGSAAVELENCSNSIVRDCHIVKSADLAVTKESDGIKIKGGGGNQVTNTVINGVASDPYTDGIRSTDSTGNYFENDFITNSATAMFLSPPDKYRAITTINCPGGIVGGIDVDGKSN